MNKVKKDLLGFKTIMFTLIHGEKLEESLNFLKALITKYPDWQVLRYDLKNEKVDINQIVESDSLFPQNRLVVFQNYFKSKKNIDLNTLKVVDNLKVVIFEYTQLGQTQISKFPKNTQIFLFKPEPIVFQFFDVFFPGNQKMVFKLFHEIKKQVDPQFFFSMFVRHVKYLLLFSDIGNKTKQPLADWQVNKYKRLSSKFSKVRLIAAYRALLKIDIKFKTGEIIDQYTPLSFLLLELTKA